MGPICKNLRCNVHINRDIFLYVVKTLSLPCKGIWNSYFIIYFVLADTSVSEIPTSYILFIWSLNSSLGIYYIIHIGNL